MKISFEKRINHDSHEISLVLEIPSIIVENFARIPARTLVEQTVQARGGLVVARGTHSCRESQDESSFGSRSACGRGCATVRESPPTLIPIAAAHNIADLMNFSDRPRFRQGG